MVKWIAAMALGLTLMFTGFTSAKDAAKGGPHGKVSASTLAASSDGKTVTGTFTIIAGKKKDTPGTETTFTVDSTTTWTLADGTASTDPKAILAAIIVDKTSVKVVAGDDKKATAVTIVEHKKKAA